LLTPFIQPSSADNTNLKSVYGLFLAAINRSAKKTVFADILSYLEWLNKIIQKENVAELKSKCMVMKSTPLSMTIPLLVEHVNNVFVWYRLAIQDVWSRQTIEALLENKDQIEEMINLRTTQDNLVVTASYYDGPPKTI